MIFIAIHAALNIRAELKFLELPFFVTSDKIISEIWFSEITFTSNNFEKWNDILSNCCNKADFQPFNVFSYI